MLTDLFVYGTLRRGQPHHMALADRSFFKGYAQTVLEYPLFRLGTGFFTSPSVVSGEVYGVDVDTLVEIGRVFTPEYRMFIPVWLHGQVTYAWAAGCIVD